MKIKNKAIIAASLISAFTFMLAGCSMSDTANTTESQAETVTTNEISTDGETTAETTSSSKAAGTYKQITQDEAMTMMNDESNYIILDVRTEAEFVGGHIPDAICIPNESIDENVVNMLPDKEQTILVYCRSGNRSKQASEKLANFGYTNIYEFGGINTWTGDIEK